VPRLCRVACRILEPAAADQAKGSIKSATGKVLGDQKLQVEGEADKAKGKVESALHPDPYPFLSPAAIS
jgi:hypothetical protein